uniref:Uncharacterized protein n=1 Tax=Anguilla anguilla TaxID=7936 RepID=A0A0E9T4C7_ANGAN
MTAKLALGIDVTFLACEVHQWN